MGTAEKLDFNKRVDKAIDDHFLQVAMRRAQDTFGPRREPVKRDMIDWEGWRDYAARVRAHTLAHLDTYLEQFVENVEKRGGKVFFAADAAEATTYVSDLVKAKSAKKIVKSKSMVTEEIHLNAALEKAGAEVIETDLGEYIIQLAKEPPSHIIVPAIHKTREQIRELFNRVSNSDLPETSEALTKFARKVLRKAFLEADMGISGCNFAVASTGTVTIVSNEGNGRLTTTVPKTHVVVMGMERIVPDWKSLDPVVSLLPRSATGQRMTTYYTAITGAKRAGDADGPEELHVVIVDNGRSEILGSKYREVLHCIRCGACLNVCPVYRHIGGHAYGSVYPGPIGAVLTPLLQGLKEWKDLPFASSLCGACQEVCPAKVPLADYLLELRKDAVDAGYKGSIEKMGMKAFGSVAGSPSIYNKAIRMAKPALGLWARDGAIENGPGPLKKWNEERSFPAPPAETFRRMWERDKAGK